MNRAGQIASFALWVALIGCASTKIDISGATSKTSLCQASAEHLSALVLWGSMWRADQKDVPRREQAAQRGLAAFFTAFDCFSEVTIRRLPGGRVAAVPTDQELLSLAATTDPKPDRVLLVVVRELGPIVQLLGSAALVEGGTDVVLDLKVLNVRTDESLAAFRIHWQNGGAFVIKGVDTLPQDMSAALAAALGATTASR
jgi:hypothetical protein